MREVFNVRFVDMLFVRAWQIRLGCFWVRFVDLRFVDLQFVRAWQIRLDYFDFRLESIALAFDIASAIIAGWFRSITAGLAGIKAVDPDCQQRRVDNRAG